jgi:hypothetical protein
MCGPLALAAIPTALSTASAVMGFAGQNAQSKANASAAGLQYGQTENQIAAQRSQIDAQQSQNTVQALIDRISAQGRISASAGAMGADAATSTRAINQAAFAAGRGLGIEDTNSANMRANTGTESQNAFYQEQTKKNQALPPSPLALALNIASSFSGGAQTFANMGGQFGGSGGDTTGAAFTPAATSLPQGFGVNAMPAL